MYVKSFMYAFIFVSASASSSIATAQFEYFDEWW